MTRVVTVCQNGQESKTICQNREYVLGVLDRALLQNPDIVCLPEAFATSGVPAPAGRRVVDQFPGPTTDAIARKAKRFRCYIICPMNMERDGRIYNSAVVIDRSGDVLGIYDKIHPVTTAHDYTVFEGGVHPGNGTGAFNLDFGRIAIQICFDAGFPETWEALAQQGAKLVFWPSAYDGGLPLQAYACLHRYYVVSSVRTDRSRIINPCGRTVAQTDSLMNLVAWDLNLDFAVCHYDFNHGVPDRIVDAYGKRVRVVSYRQDGSFLVEPVDPDVGMAQLQAEFGFEAARDYYGRHRESYHRILHGQEPLPQKAEHGDRPQYAKQ